MIIRNRIIFFLTFFLSLNLYCSQFNLKKTFSLNPAIDAKKILVYKQYLFIQARETDSIYLYQLDTGKFVRHFSGKGDGAGKFLYISDFLVTDKAELVISGSLGGLYSKIVYFDLSGKIVKELKINHQIEQLFYFNASLYYSTRDSVYKTPLKAGENHKNLVLELYKLEGGAPLIRIPDQSYINLYHPKLKNKFLYPWFPAPFPNRISIVSINTKGIYIFQSRKKSFTVIKQSQNNLYKIKEKQFRFGLFSDRVLKEDKEKFITKIKDMKKTLNLDKTFSELKFPKYKNLFSTSVHWDDNAIGLIKNSYIYKIALNGALVIKIPMPSLIDKYNESNPFFINKGVLYFVKDTILYQFNVRNKSHNSWKNH